jgi:hypothetical protein
MRNYRYSKFRIEFTAFDTSILALQVIFLCIIVVFASCELLFPCHLIFEVARGQPMNNTEKNRIKGYIVKHPPILKQVYLFKVVVFDDYCFYKIGYSTNAENRRKIFQRETRRFWTSSTVSEVKYWDWIEASRALRIEKIAHDYFMSDRLTKDSRQKVFNKKAEEKLGNNVGDYPKGYSELFDFDINAEEEEEDADFISPDDAYTENVKTVIDYLHKKVLN